nr:hypothetical protein [Methanosarcina barkeri]
MLLEFGSRCCIRTKAAPGSASEGIAEKKASNAANPPADAPMPTIGKSFFGDSSKDTSRTEFSPVEFFSIACGFSSFDLCISSLPMDSFSLSVLSHPSQSQGIFPY